MSVLLTEQIESGRSPSDGEPSPDGGLRVSRTLQSLDRGKIAAALRAIASGKGEAIRPGEWAKAKKLIAEGKAISYEGAGGTYVFDAKGDVKGHIGKFIVDGDKYKQIEILQ